MPAPANMTPAPPAGFNRDPIGVEGGDPNQYRYCLNGPINFVDPSVLDLFNDITNFASGWGDALSFGLTDWVRNQFGLNDVVDKNFSAYAAGSLTGAAHGLAMGAPGVVHTAARLGRGARGVYQLWRAGRGTINIRGRECSKLYVYTSKRVAEEITNVGRIRRPTDEFVYLTPNGQLTPLQAQLELALPQANTAEAVFEIPVSYLDPEKIALIRRVTGNINNRPGGGWEVLHRGPIPYRDGMRIR